MSNKIIVPLVIVLSLITIGVASLTQLSKAPDKVAINSSSEVVSSVKSQVVSDSNSRSEISISQISARSQTMDSAIQELFKYTISGNLNGNIPILLNINSESEAEYEYNGVSQTPIPLKILNDSKDLVLQENNNTYFRLDYITLQGTWTDGKNTYPLTLFKTDRLSMQDVIKSNLYVNSVIEQSKQDKVPTFDSINKANTKLITSNLITSITVGKCNLETKFKAGICDILDQDSNTIARVYSSSGIPMLTERTTEIQRIVTLVRAYGACGLTEYEFNFKTNYFSVSKSLVSPGCKDMSVVDEIKKYEDAYYKNSEKLLQN